MDRSERVILANMCMIYDHEGRVLVEDRRKPQWPGITFPGGHVEPGESFVRSVIREILEETGLTIEAPRLCGIKQFPIDGGARYVVLLFKTDRFSGSLTASEEGPVFWVKRSELDRLQLASEFAEMLRVFESDEINELYDCEDNGEWKTLLL